MEHKLDLVDGPGPLLPGRIAVITGGGGAIGSAAARLFARHGATCVIVDIDEKLANDAVESIVSEGGAASAFVTDVRDRDQVRALGDAVLTEHGHVDVLVNNVGHWVRHVDEFVNTDPALWDELHRVNYLHVLLVTHAFLPAMIERHAGSIINVSSVEALRGYPADPVYGGYKAAVAHFTKCLAVQVGNYGVRVNGIGPDVTESLQVPYSEILASEEMAQWPKWVPVGRMGMGDDQARVLLFLASDLSAFVTGQTIATDGGTEAGGGWYRNEARPNMAFAWTARPLHP
jgi:NAD(P)-dependent dehydrogenase (short-subunit alcohol dehydrogenase family)